MDTACRLCGSGNTKRKYQLCPDMRIMGEAFQGDCWISICSDCGFVFNTYSDVKQDSFTDYYCSNNSKTVNYYEVYSKEQAMHIFSIWKNWLRNAWERKGNRPGFWMLRVVMGNCHCI